MTVVAGLARTDPAKPKIAIAGMMMTLRTRMIPPWRFPAGALLIGSPASAHLRHVVVIATFSYLTHFSE
jgi:hypothetical protein